MKLSAIRILRNTHRTFPALVLTVLVPLLVSGEAKDTLTLYDAIREGKVDVTVSGTGASSGDSVRIRIARAPGTRRTHQRALTLSVPPGSILQSDNPSAQSMVIMGVRGEEIGRGLFARASSIKVPSTGARTYILSAFCAQFERDKPSPSDTFRLSGRDPVLACIAKKGKSLSLQAEQAAVWMYTDHITYEKMSEKLAVSVFDWAAGERVYQGCTNTLPTGN